MVWAADQKSLAARRTLLLESLPADTVAMGP